MWLEGAETLRQLDEAIDGCQPVQVTTDIPLGLLCSNLFQLHVHGDPLSYYLLIGVVTDASCADLLFSFFLADFRRHGICFRPQTIVYMYLYCIIPQT